MDAPPTDLRLSENYCRLVRTQWQPRSIDDPDFPRAVYAAGQQYGWSLREMCITRTLFESGARVSEVLALTAGDWADGQFRALDERFTRSKDAFAAPRFQALYRVWRERGDAVVQASVSPALADIIARRVGQLECRLLTHRYRHLSPLLATA